MSEEISVSDLKSVCPFCGGNWEFNAYFSPDGLVVSCKDCGAIVDAHVVDARPIEDALNKSIAELEYNAANNAMSIHAIMSTLDIDDETHGIADDMYETAHNLAHKLRAHAEQLKTERDEARTMVERLVEAISGYFFGEEPPATWRKKLSALVAEWKEMQK